MKTKNFKFKSMALVLFALVLSSNVWGETVSLTNAIIKSNASGKGSYGNYTVGGFGGKYMISSNSGTYFLQLGYNANTTKSANNSHLTTPQCSGAITQIQIVTNNSTASGRTFYLCASEPSGGCASSGDYGSGSTSSTNGTATINVTGSPTQFHIYPNGTAFIESVTITYSSGPSCTTPPTVSAGAASDATTNSLTFNCAGITSLGSTGCSITEYGYVYGTSSDPTTSNTKHKVGESYTTTGTAFAAYTATGLNCGTTYYMRPYAINGKGTAYGALATLATSACLVDHFIDNVQGYTQQDKQGDNYTIPSCGDKTKDTGCEGEHYKFIGWSKTQIPAGTQEKEPSGLLKAGETHDADGTTYYAVWAKEAE